MTVATEPARVSIVIPAHNEEAVIGRSLRALTEGTAPGELEVIVVCNGCKDATAEKAREFSGVTVIETEVASKSHALNLGDEAATVFPRLYMDADVLLDAQSVRSLASALSQPGALAAAPRAELLFPTGASWPVRAYHHFWMALPYIQEGMVTAGVYGVSEAGRRRFGRFPDVIADDGYFRLLFTSEERIEVGAAVSKVWTPGNLRDLVRTRTRSRLGLYQLQGLYPELFARETESKDYGGALGSMLKRPSLYPAAVPYLWVNLVSRLRARRQQGAGGRYVWERDESSRRPADLAAGGGV